MRAGVEARAAFDDDASVRATAVEMLGTLGAWALELVMEARHDDDARVVEAAATALGAIGSPAALAWLEEAAAAHPDRLVREAAVASLGEIGDPSAIPTLLEVLAGGPPQVRRRAVVALTVFDGPEIETALRRAAADRNPMVREVAEMVVGRAGDGGWYNLRLTDKASA